MQRPRFARGIGAISRGIVGFVANFVGSAAASQSQAIVAEIISRRRADKIMPGSRR